MPRLIERGSGRPLVLVPGLQGRCEWNLPTLDALSTLGRAVTYSLADEPSSGYPWRDAAGFENYLDQLADVMRSTAARRPVLVGVSYGGLIAAEFAARHPEAVAGLVLASAPPPAWTLPSRAQRYLKAPRLMGPVFWLGAPFRMYPELRSAFPDIRERLGFVVEQGRRIAAAPVSSSRMARRLEWLSAAHSALDGPLDLPALIVTGEPGLERVVPPAATLAYRAWLPGARVATLNGTGHGGTVTKATAFAGLVGEWLMQLPPARPSSTAAGITKEPARADRVS